MSAQEHAGTLGVGVIGCGAIARMHLAAYRDLPAVRTVAVASRSPERAALTAQAWGVEACRDCHALLSRPDIDLVSICTPSGAHGEIAIEALRAKKHVVVEKPLEVTLEKIDAMTAAARENGVSLSCIFNNRYRPGHRFVKRALEAGRLGRLISAGATVCWYRAPAYYESSDWKGTWALDGGGALMNQAIHYVDLLLWYAGAVAGASGYTGALLHRGIETEDTAVAVLRFASGALGSLTATTSTYPGFPAELRLTGTRGTVVLRDGFLAEWAFVDEDPLDAEAPAYFGAVDNGRASDPMAFDHAGHLAQLRETVEAVMRGDPPPIDGAEARKAVELILRIYASARTGREMTLSSV